MVEGNGDGNVLFVPNEYADTENDYANEIGEDSLNDQAKEEAFEDYYDQLLTNVVWKKPFATNLFVTSKNETTNSRILSAAESLLKPPF